MLQKFGGVKVGHHFIAITDKGSKLEGMAQQLKFRKIFFNDHNVGGRFSALTHFGLVPAALIGLDLNKLLKPGLPRLRNLFEGLHVFKALSNFLITDYEINRESFGFIFVGRLPPTEFIPVVRNDCLKQLQTGLIRPEFFRVGDMNLKSPARLGLPLV